MKKKPVAKKEAVINERFLALSEAAAICLFAKVRYNIEGRLSAEDGSRECYERILKLRDAC